MNDMSGKVSAAIKAPAAAKPGRNAYSYFPGCSLTGSAGEYDASLRLTSAALGIRLDEISDWNCVGLTGAAPLERQPGRIASRPQPAHRR